MNVKFKKINLNKLSYFTYVCGKIVLCKVLKINNENLFIQTEYGTKRNIHISKLFNKKKDLIKYLIQNEQAINLTKKYCLRMDMGLEEEIY